MTSDEINDSEQPDRPIDLTVLIPAHNEEQHLGEQLDALAGQAWPGHRWEVVVVDNRSTDRTVEVTEHFVHRLADLRVVSAGDRSGLSYARNTGIAAALSDHIAICDADDVVGEGWVAAMGDALGCHDLVTGVLEVDRLNPRWLADTRGRRRGDGPQMFQDIFPVASGGNLGLHRKVWEELGGFSEKVPGTEDIHFSMEAWRHGVDLHVAAGAVLHYRYHDDPRSLWRQGRSYGRGRVRVCRDLHGLGVRPRRFAGWKSWLWLIVHLPGVRTPEGRAAWVWVIANRVGQVEESIRSRSLYL